MRSRTPRKVFRRKSLERQFPVIQDYRGKFFLRDPTRLGQKNAVDTFVGFVGPAFNISPFFKKVENACNVVAILQHLFAELSLIRA